MNQLFNDMNNQTDDAMRIILLRQAFENGTLNKELSNPGLYIKSFYNECTFSERMIAREFVKCFGKGLILDQVATNYYSKYQTIIDCIDDSITHYKNYNTLSPVVEIRMLKLILAFRILDVHRASHYSNEECIQADKILHQKRITFAFSNEF